MDLLKPPQVLPDGLPQAGKDFRDQVDVEILDVAGFL